MFKLGSSWTAALLASLTLTSLVVACAGGSGSGPDATITAPPFPTTPSPAPTVGVLPPAVTFSSGNPAPQEVVLNPPDLSDFEFSIVADGCSSRGIASALPSPAPSSNPSNPTPSNVYNITPGATNGTCAFTFEDEVSHGSGKLTVKNASGKNPTTRH